VFDVDPATSRKKGTPTPSQFVARVYCGEMAVWMKTPLGTEVDLGSGHIVLDGVPAPAKGAQQPPPLFSAHVCCGHGRPSQLLLSSCTKSRPKTALLCIHDHLSSHPFGKFHLMISGINFIFLSVNLVPMFPSLTHFFIDRSHSLSLLMWYRS